MRRIIDCIVHEIIVAIDYFSKWVKARAIVQANAIEIMIFFVEDVISRHSVPSTLITGMVAHFQTC